MAELLRVNRSDYSIALWVNDTRELCREFAASPAVSDLQILEYTRKRYPEPWAARLARKISLALAFLAEHRRDLENAEAIAPGTSDLPRGVVRALYAWLIVLPWSHDTGRDDVPAPALDFVLEKAKSDREEVPQKRPRTTVLPAAIGFSFPQAAKAEKW